MIQSTVKAPEREGSLSIHAIINAGGDINVLQLDDVPFGMVIAPFEIKADDEHHIEAKVNVATAGTDQQVIAMGATVMWLLEQRGLLAETIRLFKQRGQDGVGPC